MTLVYDKEAGCKVAFAKLVGFNDMVDGAKKV